MNRRGTGIFFILIASFLYCTKFLTAAIFGSGVMSWSYDLYHVMLDYVGNSLNVWSLLSLLVGLFYLVWAELDSLRNSKIKDQKKV